MCHRIVFVTRFCELLAALCLKQRELFLLDEFHATVTRSRSTHPPNQPTNQPTQTGAESPSSPATGHGAMRGDAAGTRRLEGGGEEGLVPAGGGEPLRGAAAALGSASKPRLRAPRSAARGKPGTGAADFTAVMATETGTPDLATGLQGKGTLGKIIPFDCNREKARGSSGLELPLDCSWVWAGACDCEARTGCLE